MTNLIYDCIYMGYSEWPSGQKEETLIRRRRCCSGSMSHLRWGKEDPYIAITTKGSETRVAFRS